jgi:predicted nucleotidyltransferase
MMSPLGRGVLTGMSMMDDSDVSSVVTEMVLTSSHAELTEALLDVTALALALSEVFGRSVDLEAQQVLELALSG